MAAEEPFKASIGTFTRRDAGSEDGQLTWLKDAANRFVTLFRPRLAQWNSER